MEIQKAVAYIRVSDPRQLEGESPETQRKKIQEYADSNNIEIIKWFFDEGVSAKNADREELHNLLKYSLLYQGKINYLIVYKMNRASRDWISYAETVKAVLKRKGITVRSATEPIDDTKMGRFMEGLFVLLGQLDNDGKSETTTDNMKSLALQGYWQHPPALGYDNTRIMNDKGKPRPSLKPNAAAQLVRRILLEFNKGNLSQANLTKFAKEIGLRSRSGKVLTEQSVNRILISPTYAGFVSDKFTEYEMVSGQHDGIITEEVYLANQELIEGRKRKPGIATKVRSSDLYWLKGTLLCGNCMKTMYASAPKTGNGSYSPRYHCSRTSCKGTRSIMANTVHNQFASLLSELKPSEGILKLYRTVLVRQANRELENLNTKIKKERTRLNEISDTRTTTIRKFVDNQLTEMEKDDFVADLNNRKRETEEKLSLLESQQSIREAEIDIAIKIMENVTEQWVQSDPDIKLRFQQLLFPDGITYDINTAKFGTSGISPLYRYLPNKKDSKHASESLLVTPAGFKPALPG